MNEEVRIVEPVERIEKPPERKKRRRRAKVVPILPSMVNPSTDALVKKTHSRYVLVMLAAKRARELLEGAECKVENHDNKYVTNAFEEIVESKIRAKVEEG